MTRKIHLSSGFTLIELMIVTIVIAILLGISIPLYLVQAERAMGAKAMENLQGIFNAEIIYMAENETFTADRVELETYSPIGPNDTDWSYNIGTATQTKFTATATRISPNGLYNDNTISIDQDSTISPLTYP